MGVSIEYSWKGRRLRLVDYWLKGRGWTGVSIEYCWKGRRQADAAFEEAYDTVVLAVVADVATKTASCSCHHHCTVYRQCV